MQRRFPESLRDSGRSSGIPPGFVESSRSLLPAHRSRHPCRGDSPGSKTPGIERAESPTLARVAAVMASLQDGDSTLPGSRCRLEVRSGIRAGEFDLLRRVMRLANARTSPSQGPHPRNQEKEPANQTLARARVAFVHRFSEPFHADVGVNLRGGEAFVPQQLLHRFQVGAAVQ